MSHEVLASITTDTLFCNDYNRFADSHSYRIMNAYIREKPPPPPPPPPLCRLVALSELTRPNATNAPFRQNRGGGALDECTRSSKRDATRRDATKPFGTSRGSCPVKVCVHGGGYRVIFTPPPPGPPYTHTHTHTQHTHTHTN